MCDNYKEEDIKQKDIYIMHYPSDKELSFSFGIIRDISNSTFTHTATTRKGSSGSPIFLRDIDEVIGIHFKGDIINNFGNFLNKVLSNIQMMYSNVSDLELIQSTLNNKKFISENKFKYNTNFNLKSGDLGNIYLEFVKDSMGNLEEVLLVEINLIN